MKGSWAFIVTYPHSLQKGPKTPKMRMGQNPWKNTMHNKISWVFTIGKKALDHPINTLWRSPHKDYMTLLFAIIPIFFYITPTVYVELAPYPLGYIPPFWKPLVETTGEPNRGADGPFPQMAVMAHIIERYACSCFSLVRENIYKKS